MLISLIHPQINLIQPLSLQEADYLCKKLEVAQIATDKFVAGEISFKDFLECLELAEMDIDDYLFTVEENLLEAGII
jgi:hypothetical protein